MIRRSILKIKFVKEDLVKDEYQKNEIAMNTQNEDESDMYSALVRYK